MTDHTTNPTEDDFLNQLNEVTGKADQAEKDFDEAADQLTADLRSEEETELEDARTALVSNTVKVAEQMQRSDASDQEISDFTDKITTIVRDEELTLEEKMDKLSEMFVPDAGVDEDEAVLKNNAMLNDFVINMSERIEALGNENQEINDATTVEFNSDTSIAAINKLISSYKAKHEKANEIVAPVADYLESRLANGNGDSAQKDLAELLSDAEKDQKLFNTLVESKNSQSDEIAKLEQKIYQLERNYRNTQDRITRLTSTTSRINIKFWDKSNQEALDSSKVELEEINDKIKELTGYPYKEESRERELGAFELTTNSKLFKAREALRPVTEQLAELSLDIEERTRILSIIKTDDPEFNAMMREVKDIGKQVAASIKESNAMARTRAKIKVDNSAYILGKQKALASELKLLSSIFEQIDDRAAGNLHKFHAEYQAAFLANEKAENAISDDDFESANIADFTVSATVTQEILRRATDKKERADEMYETLKKASSNLVNTSVTAVMNAQVTSQKHKEDKTAHEEICTRYNTYAGVVPNSMATLDASIEGIRNIVTTLMNASNARDLQGKTGLALRKAKRRSDLLKEESIKDLNRIKQSLEDTTQMLNQDAVTQQALNDRTDEALKDTKEAVRDLERAQAESKGATATSARMRSRGPVLRP